MVGRRRAVDEFHWTQLPPQKSSWFRHVLLMHLIPDESLATMGSFSCLSHLWHQRQSFSWATDDLAETSYVLPNFHACLIYLATDAGHRGSEVITHRTSICGTSWSDPFWFLVP